MGSVTDKGYQTKTQNAFFEEEQALYKAIDPDWLLDPSTPDGMKIAHDAEVFGALDQAVKQAYDARDPNKATGYDLDVLRELTGAKRSLGTPSTVTLYLTGAPYTRIPHGSKVKTATGVTFETDEDVVIQADGNASVGSHCTENGAIEVSSNTLTQIVDTVGGWYSVTNREIASIGPDRDSDTVFRVKSAKAVAKAGNGIVDNIFAQLFAVSGVRKVQIYSNRTDSDAYHETKNPHSLPDHSMAIIVDGGTDQDVAQAIYDKLAPGVMLYGCDDPIDRTVYSKLYPKSYDVITFSRPVYKDVTIKLTIKDPMGTLPTDSEIQELIRDAYIDFYEGDLLPSGIGFLTTGFDIGDMIPYSRMYTPANKVLGDYTGAFVDTLLLNDQKDNLEIPFNGLARFTRSNITVTVQRQ